jgi:hypothetical protein
LCFTLAQTPVPSRLRARGAVRASVRRSIAVLNGTILIAEMGTVPIFNLLGQVRIALFASLPQSNVEMGTQL